MAVPKVISATDFTDESNPTVTFTNTSGRKISMFISVVLAPGDEMMYIRTDPAFYSSPYTFDIPEYTRQYIREDFPNKKKLTVHIGVIDSGTEEGYYVTKTMTFVNGEPEFTNINGYDADSLVVNVTGDNSILLMGKSNFAIDWTPAVGKKYATIKSYKVEWQDQSKTYTASASHPVSDFVLASSGTSLLRITATDSRGFTTTVEKELNVIEYVPPIAVVTIDRINNYEDETKFKIDASYTSVMAGDVEKNSITCKYRYKQNSETAVWSEWTTINNNEEITILFPKENEYLIQYTATDAFGEIWSGEYKLNKGKFPMFIDTELNAVGINDFPREGEALRVGGGSLVAEDAQFTGKINANDADFNGTVNINGIPIKGCHKIRTSKTGDEGTYTYDSIDYYMTSTHKIYLEEKVSEQLNGIILVWSYYANGTPQGASFQFTVIPKTILLDNPSGGGIVAMMASHSIFALMGAKYIYVRDSYIFGHDNNNKTGTGTSGIKYSNKAFVLRWVYGF